MRHRLVLGGVSSGKSSLAEEPLRDIRTLYVATGPLPEQDDPAWQHRVQLHRERRPQHWGCAETSEVAALLTQPHLARDWDAVLVDSVTTLVSTWVDAEHAWDDVASARELVQRHLQQLLSAIQDCPVPVVFVSDEVGLGGVSAHPSGRLFADLLGRANSALADVCEDTVLVVAGSPFPLTRRQHTPAAQVAIAEPTSRPDADPTPGHTAAVSAVPWRDAWRLSVGTFTRWPVRPPSHIDSLVAGRAMLLAPLVVVPLALGMALIVLIGAVAPVPALGVATLAYAAMVWMTRLMHVDGLADTIDGLCVAHDPARSLRAMKAPDLGPGGVVALLVSALLQISCLAYLMELSLRTGAPQWVLAPSLWGLMVAVVGSRWAVAWGCRSAVPSANPAGLGATVAGCVTTAQVVLTGVAVVVLAAAGGWSWGIHPAVVFLVVLAQWLSAAVLVRAAVRRFGGITGDVLGAVIEVACTVGLCVVAGAAVWGF